MRLPFFEVRNVHYEVESILNIEMETMNQTLLEEVSFQVNKKEVIGIVGKNGAGKTTLCKLISGVELPSKGKIYLENNDVYDISPQWRIHEDIAMVFQNIDEQFIGKTCKEDSLLYLSNFGYSDNEIERRLTHTAKELGVEELLEAPLVELSGGQKQLLAITEVLALQPKLLILDEPTAQLDEVNEALVMNQINKMVEKEQVTIILVSHKVSELKNCHRILGLAERTIQHSLPADQFLTNFDLMKAYHLSIPPMLGITNYLQQKSFGIASLNQLDVDVFIDNVKQIFTKGDYDDKS